MAAPELALTTVIVRNDRWFGLTCTINGTIRQLYMPNNNLRGTLPASLNVFSDLEWFNVNGDYDDSTVDLAGPLPDISQLNLLQFSIGLDMGVYKPEVSYKN